MTKPKIEHFAKKKKHWKVYLTSSATKLLLKITDRRHLTAKVDVRKEGLLSVALPSVSLWGETL